MKTTAEVDPVNAAPGAGGTDATDGKASFAETALKLGGKSEEEARRTGAIDKADDQVEGLFAARFQTVNSPVHRAVWDRHLPAELFVTQAAETPTEVQRVMDNSLAVVRRHREAGTVYDQERKISRTVLEDLAAAGYWGLLVDREYGGSGRSVSRIRAVFGADGNARTDDRRPGERSRLHRRGRSGSDVRQPRAEAAVSATPGQR